MLLGGKDRLTRTWPRHVHIPTALLSGPLLSEMRVGRWKEGTELSALLHPVSPMHLLLEVPACETKLAEVWKMRWTFFSTVFLSPFTMVF